MNITKRVMWKTKGGAEIPVDSMTDGHLVNTIRMLRKQDASASTMMDQLWGVQTSLAEAAMVESLTRNPMLDILEHEAARRGLETE